ncbi:class D beta-lactamase, partial [Desulfobulbus sp. TB]|nr:class D beta-lactamase [Desulfobulbus sp. TB]
REKMFRIKKIAILISIFSLLSAQITLAEDPALQELFQSRKVKGTIVISSLDGATEYISNTARSEKRFLPASTFKIPNTLIALAEGAVANAQEVLKWDGKDAGWPAWNKDQSIETAFPVSCVWFYQELAKRVGNSTYVSHLEQLQYGNKITGPDVITFWLEGDLRISAQEQIAFLKKLYNEQLSYSKEHQDVVKKIMIVDETPQYTIRAKTGWTTQDNQQIGWYVGYVTTEKQVWFFATNIDINEKSDLAYRKEITRKALQIKGII